MDIAELVIKIRATAEGVESTLDSASQKVQTFAKEAEKATKKPMRLDVQTQSVTKAAADVAQLGKAATGMTDQFKRGSNAIRDLFQSVSTVTGQTMAQAREIAKQAGAETNEQISAMIQAAQKGYQEIGEAAQEAVAGTDAVAESFEKTTKAAEEMVESTKNAGESAAEQLAEAANKVGEKVAEAGNQGAQAGTEAAVGAGTATVSTIAWAGAVKVLKTALGSLGYMVVMAGVNALIKGFTDWIENIRKAREEAERLREETIKTSTEAARKYEANAASIRTLRNEYADLGNKIRTSSEENSFLQLQGKIAEALGMTTDAVAAQSDNIDTLLGKMVELEKANAALAAGEAKKAADLLLASDKYTEAAQAYADTHRKIIAGGELSALALEMHPKPITTEYTAKRQEMVEQGKTLAELIINSVLDGATAQGKAMEPQARERLTDILLAMQPDMANIGNWMSADQIKDADAATAYALSNVAQNVANNPQVSAAIDTMNSLWKRVYSGDLTPEEAVATGIAQADVLQNQLAAAFSKAGVDAEQAAPAIGEFMRAVVDDRWLGDAETVAKTMTEVAQGWTEEAVTAKHAAAETTKAVEDMGTAVKKLGTDITKAKGLAEHVKSAKDAVTAYKNLSKELQKSPAEIAKVNVEMNKLGMTFDGSEQSVKQAEDGISAFEASLVQQATTLQGTISSLEAQFVALGDSAYVHGVLTADARDMLEKIALARAAYAELLAMPGMGKLIAGAGSGKGGGGSKKKSKAELAEEARRAAEEARQEAIRQDYALLDHHKHMNQLTLEAELQMLYQIRDAHALNAKEIMAWEQKVYDVRQELRRRDADSIDKAGNALIDALSARYQAMQEAEIQRLDASRKAWEDWRDDSVKAIRDQIAALDELSKTQDREKLDQEELRKIAKLRQDVEFEQNDYNRMKLQQQLDQAISARENRLRRLAVQDQKDALQKQIEAIQDQAEAQFKALDSEQEAIEKSYAERMKTAALRAEAEKLIMAGNQQEIISLLGEFAPEYDALGKTLGEKLLEGFQSKVGSVVDWFQRLNDSLYAIQEQAASQAIAAANQFQSGYQQRQQGSAAANAAPPTVVNQTVNFNEPVESAGDAARRIKQANEELGALLYGG